MSHRFALATVALCLLACRTYAADPPPPVLKVIPYCSLPGLRCLDITTSPPDAELVSLSWCCGYDGSPCVLVAGIQACDPEAEYAVICEWGLMLPDGSIECYD